jgi:diguanylate cyclase (GGDEF)-like protein
VFDEKDISYSIEYPISFRTVEFRSGCGPGCRNDQGTESIMIPTVSEALKKKQIIDEIDSLNQEAYSIRNSDPEKSMVLASRAYASAEEQNYPKGIANSLHITGILILNSGELQTAVEKIRQALDIFTDLNDEEGMSSTLNTLGITLRNIGNLDRALDFLMRSLKIQENIGNKSNIAKLNINIGNIFDNKGEFSEGLQYYKRCLDLTRKLKDDRGLADVYSNIGVCHQHLKQYSKSIKNHTRALEIRKSLNDNLGIALTLNNMGIIYELNGKYNIALNYYLESLDVKIQHGMKLEIARSCNTIGNLYTVVKDYDMAAHYLDKGAKLSQEIGSMTELRDSHEYLASLYRVQGDYSKALSHHMEFHRIDKEIFDSRRISSMKIQLELMHSELFATNRKLEDANVLLSKLSITDSLTGIFNRRRFSEFLAAEWNRCMRSESPIALIMIDIDFFKLYNDTYGHTLGDDCLKMIAGSLAKEGHRPTDLVARYGGEEFAIILSETGSEGVMRVSETARADVEKLGIPHEASVAADVVTISLGVATMVPQKNQEPSVLIQRADKALYESKRNGRNRITQFEV